MPRLYHEKKAATRNMLDKKQDNRFHPIFD